MIYFLVMRMLGDIFNSYHRNHSRLIAITTIPYIAIPICSNSIYQSIVSCNTSSIDHGMKSLWETVRSNMVTVIVLILQTPSSDETGKTEAPCYSRCGTIKIPPCSKALSTEHRPKFCSPSPAMVTSSYKWEKNLERDVNNQSITDL
jgi:hypothetical protein